MSFLSPIVDEKKNPSFASKNSTGIKVLYFFQVLMLVSFFDWSCFAHGELVYSLPIKLLTDQNNKECVRHKLTYKNIRSWHRLRQIIKFLILPGFFLCVCVCARACTGEIHNASELFLLV